MGCALKHLHRNAIVSAFFYDGEAAMIFETHAHYDDESFNDDREALIRSLPEKGIGRIINVGASIETTKTTLLQNMITFMQRWAYIQVTSAG